MFEVAIGVVLLGVIALFCIKQDNSTEALKPTGQDAVVQNGGNGLVIFLCVVVLGILGVMMMG